MKKVSLLFFVVLLIAFDASAQLEKGRKVINTTLAYSTSTETPANQTQPSRKSTALTISPGMGFLYKDRREFGASVFYETNKLDSIRNHRYGIGFYQSSYFPIYSNFFFSLSPSLDYSRSEARGGDANNVNLGLSPGISYFLRSRIEVGISIQSLFYANYFKSNSSSNTVESFSVGVTTRPGSNLAFNLGYYF